MFTKYWYTYERWTKIWQWNSSPEEFANHTIYGRARGDTKPVRFTVCAGFEFISKESSSYFREKRGGDIRCLQLSTEQLLTPSLKGHLENGFRNGPSWKKYPPFTEQGRSVKTSNHSPTTNAPFITLRLFIPSQKCTKQTKMGKGERGHSDHGETRQPADWLLIYTTQTQHWPQTIDTSSCMCMYGLDSQPEVKWLHRSP